MNASASIPQKILLWQTHTSHSFTNTDQNKTQRENISMLGCFIFLHSLRSWLNKLTRKFKNLMFLLELKKRYFAANN